jgi:uncharacterized phage protein (TIGR01671 family)
MREIKFRAWDKQRSRMLYGNNGLFMFVGTGGLGWNFADTWDVGVNNDYTLMQFTGLHDKNGKEIYEGDICRFYKPNSYTKAEDLFEVRWNPSEASFRYWSYRIDDWAFSFQKKLHNIGNNKNGAWCEVVGNIYENKELLNG